MVVGTVAYLDWLFDGVLRRTRLPIAGDTGDEEMTGLASGSVPAGHDTPQPACGACGLPISAKDTGLRYCGDRVSHSDGQCVRLLRGEIFRLREGIYWALERAADGNEHEVVGILRGLLDPGGAWP
jgi:hypothetical protein